MQRRETKEMKEKETVGRSNHYKERNRQIESEKEKDRKKIEDKDNETKREIERKKN